MDISLNDRNSFASEFLEEYLSNGFGVMSKREIDILVLSLLMKHTDLHEKNNHQLSLLFKIPESRIRSLRYEAKLKYQQQDTIAKDFFDLLASARFDVDDDKIIIVIEDQYLRLSLQGRMKEKGMFADSSFNSELVKIKIDFLKIVVFELLGETSDKQTKEKLKEFSKAVDSHQININEKNGDFKSFLVSFATDVAVSLLSTAIIR